MKNHFTLLLIILVLGTIVLGFGIGRRDLWAPDEPRFGQVTREILQRHDPFVLYLNGRPYTDKPPLQMWMAALITLAGGGDGSTITSFSMRAPSVLGGLIGLAVTYALGVLLFGSRRAGFLSAVALATTFMYFWQAGRAQLDMLMSGWSYLAVLAFWMALKAGAGRARIGWWGLFWIAGGLATLSKGPPGLIVPLGTAAFFLMWQENARRTLWTAVAWSAGVFILTLLPRFSFMQGTAFLAATAIVLVGLLGLSIALWFVPLHAKLGGGLFRRILLFCAGVVLCLAIVGVWFIPYRLHAPGEASSDTLVTQTVTRYLAGLNHQQSIVYYLPLLPHNLMPWTLFIGWALVIMWRPSTEMSRDARRFLLSWILFTLVFFSLSPGKRDQYLLPSIPAYALLAGWFFDVLMRAPRERTLRSWVVPAYAIAALAGLAAVAMVLVQAVLFRAVSDPNGWAGRLMEKQEVQVSDLTALPFWPLIFIPAVVCAMAWVTTRRRNPAGVFIACALLTGGVNVYLNGWLLPALDPVKSGRHFTEQLAEYRKNSDEPVGIYDVFRAEYMVYGDYFLTEIPKNRSAGDPELHAFLRQPKRVYVLFRDTDLENVRKRYPDLPLRDLFTQKIGHRELILVDNQSPETRPAP